MKLILFFLLFTLSYSTELIISKGCHYLPNNYNDLLYQKEVCIYKEHDGQTYVKFMQITKNELNNGTYYTSFYKSFNSITLTLNEFKYFYYFINYYKPLEEEWNTVLSNNIYRLYIKRHEIPYLISLYREFKYSNVTYGVTFDWCEINNLLTNSSSIIANLEK